MPTPGAPEPPPQISYTLEEALELLAVLEDVRETMLTTGHLAGVVALEVQCETSAVDSVSTTQRETPMPAEPLLASEAARRLELPTKELLRLIHERKIRYVMVNGIAHIPEDALDEYRRRDAS